MFNYRDALTILIDINLIIVISMYLISSCLYLTNKNKKIKLISYLYFLDFIIFTIALINTHINSKIDFNIYILSIYNGLKIIYIYCLNKKSINLIIIINLIQLISLFFTTDVFYLLNIIVNLLYIKKMDIDYVNKLYKSVSNNLRKVNKNKDSLYIIENEINKAKLFKEENENKILSLDLKINKAINEVDMPIFIIDSKNQISKINNAFRLELKKYNIRNIEDINIYLEKNFINSIDGIEFISKIKQKQEENIELYTYDEKVYKLTCIKDYCKNNEVKIYILNNITQSNLIQKKLIESEEKYRKLMDILSDGVIIHDTNSISYINDSAISLFGLYSNNENMKIEDIKNKIDIENISDFMKSIKFINEGKEEKITSKIKTQSGLTIEMITTKININNNFKLLTIAIDITSIENAIRELDESKQYYKMLIQNLPEGVVIIDKNTKNYIYQNRAMIKILKSSGIESISKIINDYIKDGKFGVPKKYKFKDKDISSIALTIIDINSENQLVGIMRCLDEEERIKAALEELDSINMQYEVKNEFLTTISQNLRSPIKNIATANNLLEYNESKYESKYINNYNKLIKRNCYRLQRLINNMNEIVEIENGFYSMEYVNCDIVKLIKNIVNTANKYLYDKGIEIKFKSNIDRKILQIDIDKVERIVLNLLSNAIKFSNSRSPITICIKEKDGYTNIIVEDQGVGIPKDKLNFIFTKFAQLDKTLTRNAEGSGVGLCLVKKLTELHKGKINVESKENVGSKFIISLPNNSKNFKGNNIIRNLNIDSEKMHIEFADIYF